MSDASIPIPTAIAKWAKRAFDAEKERDHLRAEVERLTTHSGALESALFAKTSELYPDLRSELDRLREEKAELLKALEPFARFGPGYCQPSAFEKAADVWGAEQRQAATEWK